MNEFVSNAFQISVLVMWWIVGALLVWILVKWAKFTFDNKEEK